MLTRPIRVLLGLTAAVWAGWMLRVGTVERQRVVGLAEGWAQPVQHFVTFAVLGALVMMAVGARPRLIFGLLVLAGLIGEFVQLATPDRTFSLLDVLPDAIGAAVGVTFAVAMRGRRGVALGAVATAVVLMVATPSLLEEVKFEFEDAECFDTPPAWPGDPQVILQADDLGDATLPVWITDPPVASVREAVAATDEFSLEAWFETSNLDQDGPARVFTISEGTVPDQVNVHLGVEGDGLSVRLRTSCELFRSVKIPDVLSADEPQHVVVTWSAGELVTYLDAVEVSRVELPWGKLDAWDPTYRALVGNEVGGERPFEGEVFSVTMWDAALSPDEIAQRWQLGP